MIEPQKDVKINSNYIGILTIYLVTALVAFTLILPTEDVWYYGAIKALIWPLYAITKIG